MNILHSDLDPYFEKDNILIKPFSLPILFSDSSAKLESCWWERLVVLKECRDGEWREDF